MVAAESLYRGWNAGASRYEEVPLADRQWLIAQLKTIQDRDGIPALAIDYVAPTTVLWHARPPSASKPMASSPG